MIKTIANSWKFPLKPLILKEKVPLLIYFFGIVMHIKFFIRSCKFLVVDEYQNTLKKEE